MPSRQDQLHSYQYSLQRVVAALVTHDPDPHRSPLRRAGTTALVSAVIAALAVGAVAIYGLLTGNSTRELRDESVVFLEKGSGARFVYLASDGRMHPVVNYTSGLLIATGQSPNLVSISRERLATVPLGDPLGLPGAPDSLPVKKDLLAADWSVCSALPAGAKDPKSTVLVGTPISGGTVAAGPAPKAMLIVDENAATFLVWNNQRFQIRAAGATFILSSLGWAAEEPWPVSIAFMNAIPQGPDLIPPAIESAGRPSGVPGAVVGQLFTDGGRQWKVAMPDGAAPLTEVQAKLLQSVPGSRQVQPLGNEFNTLPPSKLRLEAIPGAPADVPGLIKPVERACMTSPVGRDSQAGIRIDPAVPVGAPVRDKAEGSEVLADFVYVPRGKGALVVAAASPSAPIETGTVSIITDTGRRYPIVSRDLLGRLGYGGTSPRQVPSMLVNAVPDATVLDPEAARKPVQTATPDDDGQD